MADVKVYLNEGRYHYFGYDPHAAKLELAVQFATAGANLVLENGVPTMTLNHVWHELNADEPVTDWAIEYRRNRNRSLSVGDVVVVGEVAFACEPIGWKVVHL